MIQRAGFSLGTSFGTREYNGALEEPTFNDRLMIDKHIIRWSPKMLMFSGNRLNKAVCVTEKKSTAGINVPSTARKNVVELDDEMMEIGFKG